MLSEEKRRSLWEPPVAAGCAAFVLGVTGLLTIASSRYAVSPQPDPLLIKQMSFLLIGIVLMFAASAVPFRI